MGNKELEFIVSMKADMDASLRAVRGDLITLSKTVDGLGDTADRTKRRVEGMGLTLKTALAGAAAGLAAVGLTQGLQSTVRTLADFEQAMSTVLAVTEASKEQLSQMRTVAKDLGATTRFSATDAANGMILLGQAGFSANEILQSIGPTLNLAQAGELDLARAAEIAGGTIRGFGLEVSEAGRVMDVLALASIASNADVTSLGEALKYAAPTARALGLELEETVAVVSKLADANIKGGQGGRGFQSFATALVSSRADISKLIGTFDIASDGLSNIVKRLVDAGITTEQVLKIFRAENLDIFTILAGEATKSSGGIDDLTKRLKEAGGTSERVAKVMDDNLNGAILNAQSAVEGFVIAIGEFGVIDLLRGALDKVSETMTFFGSIVDKVRLTLTDAEGELNGFGVALQAAFQVAGLIAGAVAVEFAIKGVIALLPLLAKGAAFAWKAVGGPIPVILTAIGALGIVLDVLYKNFEVVRVVVDAVGGAITNLTTGFLRFLGVIPTEEQQKFKDELAASTAVAAEYAQRVAEAAAATGEAKTAALEAASAQRQLTEDQVKGMQTQLAALKAQQSALETQYAAWLDNLSTAEAEFVNDGGISARLAAVKGQVQELTKATFEADQVLIRSRADQGAQEWNEFLKRQAAAVAAAAEAQKKVSEEQQKSISDAVKALQDKERAAQQAVKAIDLEGAALARSNASFEFANDLRKSGLHTEEEIRSILAKNAGLIANIGALEEKRQQRAADKKVYDSLNSEKKAYDDLTVSLNNLIAAGQASAEDKASELASSALQKGYRSLLSELGPEGAAQAAKLTADAEYTIRLASAQRLGTALGLSDQAIAQLRLDVERQYQTDLSTIQVEAVQQRADLIKQLGLAPEDQLGISELDRQRRQIEAETAQKLQLLEQQKALFLGKENEYQAARQQIIDNGAKKRQDAERASLQVGLQSFTSGMEALTGALKEGLGENNAIYKAAFVATKAAAIANSIINIQAALSSAAASAPFPANLGVMATVAAETAGIISTIMSTKLALADGGYVSGPGGPRSDSIPAYLSNGEFVMNAASTKQFLPMLEQMNAGRRPRFADGGLVGRGSPMRVPGSTGGGGVSVTIAPLINIQASGNAQQDRNLAADTERRTREAILAVIRDETRVGGSLEAIRR